MPATRFTENEALAIGQALGIDWHQIDLTQFKLGLEVELEHGKRDPATDVTGDDPITTGKIALAHLKEFPDYYSRLAMLESDADRFWRARLRSGSGCSGDELG